MSKLFRITMWIAILVGIGTFTFFQIVGLVMLPLIQVAGSVLGLLYAALVVWILSRTRLWPRSGKSFGWVAAALIWGAGSCLPLVFVSATAVTEIPIYLRWDKAVYSFGGAYPEEFYKALGVIIICLAFRQINRPWHALIVGMLVGLGFESNENMLYGGFGALIDPVSDWSGLGTMWSQRLLIGPFIHILLTGLAGWGIGWALYAARWSTFKRISYAMSWLALSFTVHFLWNYVPEGLLSYTPQVAAALILYPTIVWVFIRAHRLAKEDPGYAVITNPGRKLPA